MEWSNRKHKEKIMERFHRIVPVLAAALALCAHCALGSGFAIVEQSASGIGSAFSGAGTSIGDASTINSIRPA